MGWFAWYESKERGGKVNQARDQESQLLWASIVYTSKG